MKLYITGSVASGKTTLARSISQRTGIPFYSLDEVVHEKDDTNPTGNRRRTPEERDLIFAGILAKPSYIIEDTGRECFEKGRREVDKIILLDIPIPVRRHRIIMRHLLQNFGLEKCGYKPTWKMLKCMFKWAREYDTKIKARIMTYGDKVIVLKSIKDIKEFEETCI
ncbi:hypothetical protein SDC9_186432 [bioreactor metagenome]|uniref:Shikimate kinase n=1 Tax=bioreactor metagenome TaxID=1076179 RepID=A0A645HIW7_9ZZZZ|nr:hypothetical protein [Oscillospiraceae bacterium]